MELNFENRVAIITGAGSGLGKAYALELAKRGAKVVVNDLGSSIDGSGQSIESSREVVEIIKEFGGEAVADQSNVADEAGAEKIVQTAVQTFGKVDILINNAGIIRDKSFPKMETNDFDSVLKVHLYGAFFVTRAAFPIMKNNNYGRIVMTTSISGLYGNFGQSNYAAAKLGIVGLMNALKEESQKYNIMVNAIAPVADTRISDGSLPKEKCAAVKPDAVAPVVVYLCSEACNTSGSIINACGNYYSNTQIVESEGYLFKDKQVTAEMIARQYNLICEMGTIRTHNNVADALTHMLKQN